MTGLSQSALPVWDSIAKNVDLFAVPDASNDIVALLAFFPVGTAMESRADAGLLSFTGRMLMRGTRRLSNAELADAIDGLGISIGFSAGDDYGYHRLTTTADALEESVTLFAETLFEPAFEPEEIEKERQTTLAAIRRSDDDLMGLAVKTFYEELYPDHGYGLPNAGLETSVGELTREQIVSCHEEVCGSRVRIVAVGNFDPAALTDLLRREFVSRKPLQVGESLAVERPVAAREKRVTLSRDSEQAYLVAGFHAPAPCDDGYYAARVLNAVLGEGMSSRLFQALREEKGLAYATGSSYSGLKLGGQLFGYIGTKPESLETAREGMMAEFERLKQELVPEDELLRAKNYMIGKFLIDHQRNFKRGFYLGHFDQMGIGWEVDNRYAELISAVTAEDVREAARAILDGAVVVELRTDG